MHNEGEKEQTDTVTMILTCKRWIDTHWLRLHTQVVQNFR